MDPTESFWEAWERILESRDPDPLEILRAAAAFGSYFEAVERDGIAFARAKGLTWAQIAEALGSSRQAILVSSDSTVPCVVADVGLSRRRALLSAASLTTRKKRQQVRSNREC